MKSAWTTITRFNVVRIKELIAKGQHQKAMKHLGCVLLSLSFGLRMAIKGECDDDDEDSM